MQQNFSLKLLPSEADNDIIIKEYVAKASGQNAENITGFYVIKKSMDARSRQVWINLTVKAYINEPFLERAQEKFDFPDVSQSLKKVIIVGAGPCGLFAALKLIEHKIQPIILERGKDVRARRRDLAKLNKDGIINPESNYCFGEGGAGTYSDGKLYTRSNKRGDINRILNLLVQFGANEKILYEAHPHIGTNKLPDIITDIRRQIVESGGKFLFEKKVSGFIIQDNIIKGVKTSDGDSFSGDAVILATGHSARDIFELLHNNKILVEAKPFALGVRIEHPQSLIDQIQYHCPIRDEHLPPASYSLVQQVNDKGVFSFCMCPGGIIAPASTNNNELVVNGWSPSKRNNPYANSGMVVTVEDKDYSAFQKSMGPLAAMAFQQDVEQKAYAAGGGNFVAPAQRMIDFVQRKTSQNLPDCSYLPGLAAAPLNEVLPSFIYNALAGAFKEFGKKMRGYYSNDAVVVATESRTSSPVRIPRLDDSLEHPQVKRLFPAGEGAGYAGGIISAAMDGEKVAAAIAKSI